MWAVPFLCFAVTAARIIDQQMISIVTWHRVDDILAGGILALLYAHGRHTLPKRYPLWLAVLGFRACSHPARGFLQYLRPYAAAAMVGTSLVCAPVLVQRALESAPMSYIAGISHALYVIYAILLGTWLGSGATVEEYLKWSLLIAATFALAHLSNSYLGIPFIRLIRRAREGGLAPQRLDSRNP